MAGDGVVRDVNEAAYSLYRAAFSGYPSAIVTLDELVTAHPRVVSKHFSAGDFSELMAACRRPVRAALCPE